MIKDTFRSVLISSFFPLIFLVACGPRLPRLDEQTLRQLTIEPLLGPVQLIPGSRYDFDISIVECCYVLQPVEADVRWSMEPEVGAHINDQTGVLMIDSTTPNGSIFTVTANVERGRRRISTQVFIYTLDANPLVGSWFEVAYLPCDCQEWIPADADSLTHAQMGELAFSADGIFSATWNPIEIYRDYWGDYSYNLTTGFLVLVPTIESNLPTNIDGVGSFSINEDGYLILENIWLGSPDYVNESPICGYIFDRY